MPSRKLFCLDTSGLSTPLENMPEDIHSWLWARIRSEIENGIFAVNQEIYDELCRLEGGIGECINASKDALVLEIGQENWDWNSYLEIVEQLRTEYRSVISEYNNGRKRTVGLNDVSIVALAKCLNLPVISMESSSYQESAERMRIPQLCARVGVEHLTFNDFMRRQGISR